MSGSNIQPVQMMDLDGDGREEALAFFRQSDGEKPLKIHIFTTDDDNSYRQAAVIEGSGLAIYSVDYSDIDGDGRMEIIVGWRVSMDLQALAVYSLEPDGARELMRTNYVKYAVADLNKDGKRELTVLRANQDGEGVADCYVSKNGVLTLRSSVLVSMTMAELSQQGKVTVGVLRSNDPALFITGVADGARAITDVLALRGGELTNLVLSAITGVSGEVSRFCSVYPMDINGDGVTEVPRTVTLQGEDADHAVSQRVDWISYDASGTASRVLSTYHDVADGWYLQLRRAGRSGFGSASLRQLEIPAVGNIVIGGQDPGRGTGSVIADPVHPLRNGVVCVLALQRHRAGHLCNAVAVDVHGIHGTEPGHLSGNAGNGGKHQICQFSARRASTSVIARAPSATPVMNRAGSLERSTPTVTFPCWLSSAMVMDTRTLDRSVSTHFSTHSSLQRPHRPDWPGAPSVPVCRLYSGPPRRISHNWSASAPVRRPAPRSRPPAPADPC